MSSQRQHVKHLTMKKNSWKVLGNHKQTNFYIFMLRLSFLDAACTDLFSLAENDRNIEIAAGRFVEEKVLFTDWEKCFSKIWAHFLYPPKIPSFVNYLDAQHKYKTCSKEMKHIVYAFFFRFWRLYIVSWRM